MAVTFTYNGSNQLQAVCTLLTPTTSYELVSNDPASSVPTGTTDSSGNLTLTITTIGGLSTGDLFYAQVDTAASDGHFAAVTEMKYGTAGVGQGDPVSFVYDGVSNLSATFTSRAGVHYSLHTSYLSSTIQTVTGDGTSKTLTLTDIALTGNPTFICFLYDGTGAHVITYQVAIFTVGQAGSGSSDISQGGSPGSGRVLIAFHDGPLVPSPGWTVIDQGGPNFPTNFVAGYDITTGRQTLLAQTDTGTATVYLNDRGGLFDERNGSSPYAGLLDGKQIWLQLQNPVTNAWESQFRGWIDNVTWNVDGTAVDANGDPINESIQIDCVDMFDVLAGYGLTPGLDGITPRPLPHGGTAGGPVPAGSEDSVYYAATAGSVDDRIIEVLADVGIDSTRYLVASGNTRVQAVKYNADESALVALRDAADAELPFIANIYIDRFGNFAFRGRYSRFDPDVVAAEAGSDWDFTRWSVGDGQAIVADPTRAQMRILAYMRGRANVINAALCYPQNTSAAKIPGQVSADIGSINTYGKHVAPPMTDLLTDTYTGPGSITPNTGLSQCALFARLFVQNQKDPREAVSALQLKSIQPTDPRAAVTWRLMTRADISHIVNVAVGYPGGVGLAGLSPDDDYYIEGRQMRVRPATTYDYVELDLEVSPAVWSMDTHGVFPPITPPSTPAPPQSSSASSPARIRRLFSPWTMNP